jgi:hypothetical protein
MRRAEGAATPVALVALAALAIRLIRLDARSFWLDEGFSTWLAAQPVPFIVTYRDFHPPGYYLLLKAWQLLGPWAASDGGVRFVSAAASAATVALGVWLVQRLGLPGSRLVAALGITSAMSVWYAQESRMYALAALLVLGAAGALALAGRALPRKGTVADGTWAAYAASGVAAAYVSYDAIPVLAALNGAFLGWCVWLLVRGPAISSGRTGPALGRTLGAWALTHMAMVAAYAPHVPELMRTIEAAPSLHLAARLPLVAAAGAVVLAGLAVVAVLAVRLPTWRRWATATAATVVVFGLAVAELVPEGASVKRHLSVVAPLLLVTSGVALALVRTPPRWQVALVCAGLPALALVLFVHPKEDWRGAASYLASEARPDDVLVLHRGYVILPLQRYLPLVGRTAVQVFSAAEAEELRAVPGTRYWVVEGHLGQSPPIGGIGPAREESAGREFHRVSIRRFEP